MNKNLTMVEARNRLTQLPAELNERQGTTITVTRWGRPVMVMMSYDLFDSIVETLEIMSDPELMTELRQSILEAENGQLISWEDIEQENGW